MALSFDPYPTITYDSAPPDAADDNELRALRKWECAIGYRIFSALRWGQIGDGHVTARDPVRTDHFWVLGYGIPFRDASVDNLVLVSPEGDVVEGPGDTVNCAAYNIHHPVLAAHPTAHAAAHTHTPHGTPWAAHAELFRPLSQESCAFVDDQALYEGEDLEVVDTAGGERIAAAMGAHKLVILRNHGLLTGGASPGEAVGWFVLAERVAEVHIKAPNGVPISEEAAKEVAPGMSHSHVGWRTFQWLARDLVPDPAVVL